MTPPIHPDAVDALVKGEIGAPTTILGRHQIDDAVSIRAFRPCAKAVAVVNSATGERAPMERLHKDGLFVAELDAAWADAAYHFEAVAIDEQAEVFGDPYAFPPLLTDYDVYLFSQGEHHEIYQKLGAHSRRIDGVSGVNFAVWAPNCYRVALIGDFNRWDARIHALENRNESGIWEIFVPGLEAGARYKFDVRSHNRGYSAAKSDPYGFFHELRPHTASIVYNLDRYQWHDSDWMTGARRERPLAAADEHLRVAFGLLEAQRGRRLLDLP